MVRGAGSLSCLALMIVGGWLVGLFPPQATPFLVAVVAGLDDCPRYSALSPAPEPRAAGDEGAARRTPIDRPFLLALTIAAATLAGRSCRSTPSAPSGFRALGFDNTTIGLLWAVSVVAEIAFFMLISRRLGGSDDAYRFLIAARPSRCCAGP